MIAKQLRCKNKKQAISRPDQGRKPYAKNILTQGGSRRALSTHPSTIIIIFGVFLTAKQIIAYGSSTVRLCDVNYYVNNIIRNGT
jgi:hypothetical protein